jgi:hypothetical protein
MRQLKYFIRIEIAKSIKSIMLSQWKYGLDLLLEIGMLDCRIVSTPIE